MHTRKYEHDSNLNNNNMDYVFYTFYLKIYMNSRYVRLRDNKTNIESIMINEK